MTEIQIKRTRYVGYAGQFTTYLAADRRRFAVTANRYPGELLGIAVQVGRRVVSWVWPLTFAILRTAEDTDDDR